MINNIKYSKRCRIMMGRRQLIKEGNGRVMDKVRNIKKLPIHLYATPQLKCEAIEENSSTFEVEKMCRLIELKAPNYY